MIERNRIFMDDNIEGTVVVISGASVVLSCVRRLRMQEIRIVKGSRARA